MSYNVHFGYTLFGGSNVISIFETRYDSFSFTHTGVHMNTIKEVQDGISKLTKSISLRQVAIQSGINYITIRNIKSGKSKRVTDSVLDRFTAFYNSFTPGSAKISSTKKGKKVVAKVAAKKVIAKNTTPKKKATRRRTRSKTPVTPVASTSTVLLGGNLKKELRLAQARLDYLRSLEKAEKDYLAMIG